MHPRAAQLITSLELSRHPEGGYFREIYRSSGSVTPDDIRGSRAALTTIYFLLIAGDVSRWHRVTSDEVWHYYEGDTLELVDVDAQFERVVRMSLGPVGATTAPVHVVPAHHWQAARTCGDYTLVGCTVAPGFDFVDFTMLDSLPEMAAKIERVYPELRSFI
jgi:predicted cupin superfamily sugar epimerase